MERRVFIKKAAVLTAAFSLGLHLGRPESIANGTGLLAFLPDGKIWDQRFLEVAAAGDLSVCTMASQHLEMPIQSDLILLGEGRILSPEDDFSHSLLSLRQLIQGHLATRLVRVMSENEAHLSLARKMRITTPASVRTVSLDDPKEFSLSGHLSGSRLRSDEEGVRMIQAACRHEHCCKMGTISRVGQRIACAPAGIMIELV